MQDEHATTPSAGEEARELTEGKATTVASSAPDDAATTPACWICHTGDDDADEDEEEERETLAAAPHFCECRGSLGTVHRSCLELLVRGQSLSSCRTCGGVYEWETVRPPGTPAEPATFPGRTWFLATRFAPAFGAHVVVTVVAALLKFVLVPAAVGTYHHALRAEWDPAEAESDTLLTALVVGTSACTMRRAVARMYGKHRAFFDDPDRAAEEDKPTSIPDASRRAHDQLWWYARRGRSLVLSPPDASLRSFAVARALDLVWGLAAVYAWFRAPLLWLAPVVFIVAIVLRLTHPPRRYKNRRQRKEEVQAARRTLTRFEIRKYFATFCLDCVFFSVVMRVLAGYAFHYSAAPFFCAIPDAPFWPTPESALVHWVIGFAVENFMVIVERTLMAPLFALGSDLIILRSVQFDEEHDDYTFVFQQLYEVDPLRAFADAARIYATEIPALALWIHLPLRAAATAMVVVFNATAAEADDKAAPGGPDPDVGYRWTEATMPGPFTLPAFMSTSSWWRAAELALVMWMLLCFFLFPVQRAALRVMYTVAKPLATATDLAAYLFDATRQTALEQWLADPLVADGDDVGVEAEAALPPVGTEQKVTRREMWMDPAEIPREIGSAAWSALVGSNGKSM